MIAKLDVARVTSREELNSRYSKEFLAVVSKTDFGRQNSDKLLNMLAAPDARKVIQNGELAAALRTPGVVNLVSSQAGFEMITRGGPALEAMTRQGDKLAMLAIDPSLQRAMGKNELGKLFAPGVLGLVATPGFLQMAASPDFLAAARGPDLARAAASEDFARVVNNNK